MHTPRRHTVQNRTDGVLRLHDVRNQVCVHDLHSAACLRRALQSRPAVQLVADGPRPSCLLIRVAVQAQSPLRAAAPVRPQTGRNPVRPVFRSWGTPAAAMRTPEPSKIMARKKTR